MVAKPNKGSRPDAIPLAPYGAQPHHVRAEELNACRRCGLWAHATQGVPGAGPSNAHIMIVGEQPGDAEDLAGKPFVGPAGDLLNQVLATAGVEREEVYVTNAVKHFKWEPRGKRRLHKTPAQREIAACRHWLEEEIEEVRPRVIVAMGSSALKSLLDDGRARLADLLGRPTKLGERWLVAIYHPAYILRIPDREAQQHAFALMAEGLRTARRLADEAQSPH